MPPKGLSPAAKQALMLDWFRNSLSAFPYTDLEKFLPGPTGVAKQQLKEFLQVLIDDGLLRVEKIGISNWYWSFVSDAKKGKENTLNDLEAEESRLKAAIADVEGQLQEARAQRQDDDDEMLEGDGMDRNKLLHVHEILLNETGELNKELAGYSDSDPTEVLRRAQETEMLRQSAERWTENIEAIESYLKRQTGDRKQVAGIMEQFCGDEYIAGEGLKDL